MWQRRERVVRAKDTLFQVSLCIAIHRRMPPREGRVGGQALQVVAGPQELGSAAGTPSETHLPAPASTSLHSNPLPSSFLPAFPFFLSPHLTDCSGKMAQIYGSTHQK